MVSCQIGKPHAVEAPQLPWCNKKLYIPAESTIDLLYVRIHVVCQVLYPPQQYACVLGMDLLDLTTEVGSPIAVASSWLRGLRFPRKLRCHGRPNETSAYMKVGRPAPVCIPYSGRALHHNTHRRVLHCNVSNVLIVKVYTKAN